MSFRLVDGCDSIRIRLGGKGGCSSKEDVGRIWEGERGWIVITM